MTLPNLMIAGAPKCGRSSLFQWIAEHPEAEGPIVKETCYFADPTSHMFNPAQNFRADGLAGYQTFFPEGGPDTKVRLEATPVYIYQDTALEHLPDQATHPKFLFILREPSKQLLSTYRYFLNNWHEFRHDVTFTEFIEMAERQDAGLSHNELLGDALTNVRYVDHLERWQGRVEADRIFVMTMDALAIDRDTAMAQISEWLGIDVAFYRDYSFTRENETYRVQNHMLQAVNLRLRGVLAKTPITRARMTSRRASA